MLSSLPKGPYCSDAVSMAAARLCSLHMRTHAHAQDYSLSCSAHKSCQSVLHEVPQIPLEVCATVSTYNTQSCSRVIFTSHTASPQRQIAVSIFITIINANCVIYSTKITDRQLHLGITVGLQQPLKHRQHCRQVLNQDDRTFFQQQALGTCMYTIFISHILWKMSHK